MVLQQAWDGRGRGVKGNVRSGIIQRNIGRLHMEDTGTSQDRHRTLRGSATGEESARSADPSMGRGELLQCGGRAARRCDYSGSRRSSENARMEGSGLDGAGGFQRGSDESERCRHRHQRAPARFFSQRQEPTLLDGGCGTRAAKMVDQHRDIGDQSSTIRGVEGGQR